MTLRTSLEAVLMKRRPLSRWDGQLIDELLAVLPQPSREQLVHIVYPHRGLSDESMRKVQDEFLDKIMAWATDQRERWCTHCAYENYDGSGFA